MTWLEIYNRTAFKVWGDTTPPTGSATVLQGDEGIIANCARKIMREYNYWFMLNTYSYEVSEDDNTHALPSDYKEMISVFWSAPRLCTVTAASTTVSSIDTSGLYDGQSVYGTSVAASTTISDIDHDANTITLSAAATAAGTELRFGDDRNGIEVSPFAVQEGDAVPCKQDENPEYYKIHEDNLITRGVYYDSDSTESGVLNILYWAFLDRPTDASFVEATADSDDLTTHAADAIGDMAAAEMFLIRKELDMYQIYNQKAQEGVASLQEQDRARRQAQLTEIQPESF